MENKKKKRETQEKRMDWLWEFSKRVVVICTAAYFIVLVYTMIAMVVTKEMNALITLLSESADILRTCVFGYFIKAGMENALKIRKPKQKQKKEECGNGKENI